MKAKRILAAVLIFGILMLPGCSKAKTVVLDTGDGGKVSVDVSQDGNAGKIEDGDSSIEFAEDMEWPADFMVGLPQPKGKITGVLKDDGTKACTVALNEMGEQDAKDYSASLKTLGYENGMDFSDAESIMFTGTGKDGATIMFAYNTTAKEATISYSPKAAEEAEEAEDGDAAEDAGTEGTES